MRAIPVAPDSDVRIGAKLRAARTARRLTLDQLSQATGLTKGFLSRIERDETSPSVSSLVTLCQVMSIDVGSLFSEADVALVRGDEAPGINLGGVAVRERLLTPRTQSRLQFVRTTAEPGGSGGELLYTMNCDIEVLHVVHGEVEVRFADRSCIVSEGDALTFSGREPHTWVNRSDDAFAELIWVLVPAPWSGS